MFIAVNGIELHWEESGEGRPLLWLHGGMGCGADWRYIFGEPPAGFRIVAPDLRGHGSSTNPTGAFTFRQVALDTIELLRHLNLTRISAIGLSGGGITLLHMATLEPGLIGSMVVISAPPYFPEQARQIQRNFAPGALTEVEMNRMRQVHKHGQPQIDQLFAMVRGLPDNDDDVNFTPAVLSTIAAETLIVFGDRDFLYPVSIACELHESIKGSHLWVVPNGGHGPVFGDLAPQFAKTAVEFLRGDWRRPPQ